MKKFLAIAAAAMMFAACNSKNQEQTQSEVAETSTEATEKTMVKETTSEETAAEASVYFVNLKEGQTVSSPVKVQMGVKGMEIEPAGEVKEGKGHHHIIINGSHIEEGTTVPMNATHIHYGGGQTEDELELEPGNYTLTLQFADGVHSSYGKEMSKTINIVVQ